jgi:hypothetical protein
MAREGGVSGISRSAYNSLTFPPILNFFKGPRPFKKQKTYLSGLTTLQGVLLDHEASGVENRIAERPMFKSALSRSASLRHSLNCGIGRSGITFKHF